MSELRKVKLGEVAEYSSKKIQSKNISIDDYITIDCMEQNKQGVVKATNLPPNSCSLTAYEKGNILIGNIRPYLKKIWFANKNGGCSADVLCLDVNKNYSDKFIYYSLLDDNFFDYMMQGKKGSKMPRGDKDQILRYEITNFNFQSQSRIASILSSLDQKIELNNRIIKELEAMAKELYDYWFVQFDFPNENCKPYKSSGGKMVYNPILKREIPEGWEVQDLVNNSITSIIKTGVEKFRTKTYLATADVVNTKIGVGNIIDFETRESRANMQPTINSVWFAKMKNTIKHLFLNKEMKSIIDNYILSTGFCGLKCSEKSFEYISSFIAYSYFEEIKDSLSHGATQESVNLSDIEQIKLVIPSKEILEKYHILTKSIFGIISKNQIQSHSLSSLRDWLLPMLMNGQLEVSFRPKGETS